MGDPVFDKCSVSFPSRSLARPIIIEFISVCKRRLVWIDELGDYIPLVSRNCRRDNCPFVNDLEADEETNYDPDNYEE